MPKLWRSLLGRPGGIEARYRVGDDYFTDFSGISMPAFAQYYGGQGGWSGPQRDREEIEASFTGMVNGVYKANGVVAACMAAIELVFSECRFQFLRYHNGRPGDMFGTPALRPLERPWPNGTTGELLTRMITDVYLSGNSFIVTEPDRLRRRRPDWMQIILSAPPEVAVDSDVEGYAYWPGGIGRGTPKIYLPHEVGHWSPRPDPDAEYRGMAWLTPVVREIAADQAATGHKLAFFRNGATLGPIFRLGAEVTITQFREFMDAAKAAHVGPENAYKPLYVGGGADVTLGSADMQQLDYRSITGAGEVRIANVMRVHPTVVGLSDSLDGSSMNAGNYSSAKRSFGDGTLRPLWRSAAAALATLVAVPDGAELAADVRDIAYLREDAKDAAEIMQMSSSTIVSLSSGGFLRQSAVDAVAAGDVTLLQEDPDWVSVQLQQSSGAVAKTAGGDGPKGPAGRGFAHRDFDPSLHPHSPTDGKFVDTPGGGLSAALDKLRLAGKIDLKPGETLVGSGKVDADSGGIRFALIDNGAERRWRIGIGGEGYGQRDRDNGISAWDANPSTAAISAADRDRLHGELEDLEVESEDGTASPERLAEIEQRMQDIHEQLTAAGEFNQTADVDEYTMSRLDSLVTPALAEAHAQNATENAAYAEIERLEALQEPLRLMDRKWTPEEEARWDELEAQIAEQRRLAGFDENNNAPGVTFAEGIIPGSQWGDIHYSVYTDDPTVGEQVYIGVLPKADPDWGDRRDWAGTFGLAEWRKFMRQVAKLRADAAGGGGLDEPTRALVAALDELEARAYSEALHPRNPKGSPGGGRFRSTVDKLIDAIQAHKGGGDPFEGFDREQLRRAAVKRGIKLPRGADRDHIAKALLADLDNGPADGPKAPKATPKKAAPRKTAKPKPPPAGALPGTVTGDDALDAAPMSMIRPAGPSERLSREQVGYLEDYKNLHYASTNDALREGQGTLVSDGTSINEYTIAATRFTDAAMDRSPLARDVTVWRGIERGHTVFGDAWDGSLVGAEWTEHGYLSTSAAESVAAEFGEGPGRRDGAVMRVRLPEGTKAVALSGSGDESEVLAQRGLRLKVVSDTVDGDGIRRLDVEVVPAKTQTPDVPAAAPKKRAPRKAAVKKATPPAAPKPTETAPAGAYTGPEFELPAGVTQADYDTYKDLAGRRDRHEAVDRDEFFDAQDKLPKAAQDRALQESRIDRNFDEWSARNHPGRNPDEVRAEMAAAARDAFADRQVAVRVTPQGLAKMLDDGRFRTFYEHGRSESLDPSSRPAAEAAMFGLGPDTDPTVRPIYGYVMAEGARPAGSADTDALSQYGQIQVVLKDETRSRTTAMFGDSLDNGQFGRPSPIDSPDWRSYTPSNGGIIGRFYSGPGRDPAAPDFQQHTYAEAQVHGGVTTGDIAEVILPAGASDALKARLGEAGVPWRVMS